MELRQMRYAVAVAQTRNFTRAAAQCFVAQSALSHQIKSLEQELGVALFARTSRRVELTAAGEAFVATARQCLEAAERAAADAAAAGGEIRGRLRLGVIPTAVVLDVPAVLQQFKELHPRVRVRLRAGASDQLAAEVAAGTLDAAILGLPEGEPPRGVEARVLAHQQLVAVVPAAHELAGRSEVTLADLALAPFADFQAGTPGRAQSDQAFGAAGLERDVAYEVSSVDLMLRLVARGLAVAFLPEPVAAAAAGTRTVPVADGPRRVEYLVWSEFNPTPAARAFLAALPITHR
ncbi:LysR family transcriptional regulator [Nocardioides pantholopis]|uniref:LysR family transcriptional regulator n=1 Tax=Nocardioides pantholopis TaxID=2483798 RepID=UPI000FDA8421|nr:LysR family transcriptional regulator [Nocardioides pantholopis]